MEEKTQKFHSFYQKLSYQVKVKVKVKGEGGEEQERGDSTCAYLQFCA